MTVDAGTGEEVSRGDLVKGFAIAMTEPLDVFMDFDANTIDELLDRLVTVRAQNAVGAEASLVSYDPNQVCEQN